MRLGLDPEQRAIVEQARAFARERIGPRARTFESEGVSRELFAELGAADLLGANVDADHGGHPLDPVTWGLVCEEISKVCHNTRNGMTVHAGIMCGTLARWGSEKQRARWLPALSRGQALGAFALSEPQVGSDAASIQTRYRSVDGKLVVDGHKRWITLAAIADLFLVPARNGDECSVFLVERDRPGVEVVPMTGVDSARGSQLAEIHLRGVELDESALVGPRGRGFDFVVATALDLGRYNVAWAGVSVAQRALELMARHARERTQFGRPLHEHQLVAAMIADAVTKVHAARSLCMHAGRLRRAGDPEAIIETNIAKQFAARIATEVVGDAIQVHGAIGMREELGFGRMILDARTLQIIEGSTQIQQLLIGAHGVRRYGGDEPAKIR